MGIVNQIEKRVSAPQLVKRLGKAANSVLKTELLRVDRLADAVVEHRLSICRECPGGHVLFRRGGRLLTCGKLLAQYEEQGREQPCGCILRYKARDAKEECPLGFWPVLDSSASPGVAEVKIHHSNNRQSIHSQHTTLPNVRAVQTAIAEVPGEDVLLEVSTTGRTRRILNVDHRRLQLQERRRPVPGPMRDGEAVQRKQILAQSDEFRQPNESSEITPSVNHDTLYDFFDRVFVVNLDRRPDRLERFYRHLAQIDWPFRYPERFRAIDGYFVKPPGWWRAGAAAWGCHHSHLRIIENAMMDNLERILILEDDAYFDSQIRERCQEFLSALPGDWQQVYLGGQHLFQRRQPPLSVNKFVVKPFNVNRTHAYGLHQRGMRMVYRWLTNYLDHSKHPRHHVDHRLGELHSNGELKVYAPVKWIAGQAEGNSNISGKRLPNRIWNSHVVRDRGVPFVAIVGLHRSGSSCIAGVLHKLGVHMGDKLVGYESTGGHEAFGLVRICEKAFPFPSTERKIDQPVLEDRLRKHIRHVQNSARAKGKIAGGKYPQLCAMGAELMAVCGEDLRVIHINRPLEESIASLRTRSRKCKNWLAVTDEQSENVQRWLWSCKQDLLSKVNHLTVNYLDLIVHTRREVDRIVEYLDIKPEGAQISEAISHVEPKLRRHCLS